MDTKCKAEDTVDERRFARVPYLGRVRFVYGSGHKGSADATDVGRGGLRVRMGRYLRPGTKLMISVPLAKSVESAAEFKAEVVWCRREPERLEFDTGLRVYYDAPEALDAISEVMYYALFEQGGLKHGREASVMHRPIAFRGLKLSGQPFSTACGLTC